MKLQFQATVAGYHCDIKSKNFKTTSKFNFFIVCITCSKHMRLKVKSHFPKKLILFASVKAI